MADYEVAGKSLKKILKEAERHPVAFAFVPGTSDPNHYLAMDRRKAPDVVGKVAKRAMKAAKVAYGTVHSDGMTLELTCEKAVDGLAKKFKQHLSDESVHLKVVLLDQDGNRIGADAPKEDAAETPDAAPETPGDASDTTGPSPEQRALAVRANAVKTGLAPLSGSAAKALGAGLVNAVKAIRAGDIRLADATLTKLEAGLAQAQGREGSKGGS